MARLDKAIQQAKHWKGKEVTISKENFQIGEGDSFEDFGFETEDEFQELLNHINVPTLVIIDDWDIDNCSTDAYYTFKYPDGFIIWSTNFYRLPKEMVDAGLEQLTEY